MALIKCDECGAEISDKSLVCIKCGNPICTSESQVRTIEATGKKWKLIIITGWSLIIFGLFLLDFILGIFGSQIGVGTGLRVLMIVVGILMLIVGKFGKYWYHD